MNTKNQCDYLLFKSILLLIMSLVCNITTLVFVRLTCFGVDREEILRVASSDAITQTTGCGSEVRVLCLDTDD